MPLYPVTRILRKKFPLMNFRTSAPPCALVTSLTTRVVPLTLRGRHVLKATVRSVPQSTNAATKIEIDAPPYCRDNYVTSHALDLKLMVNSTLVYTISTFNVVNGAININVQINELGYLFIFRFYSLRRTEKRIPKIVT